VSLNSGTAALLTGHGHLPTWSAASTTVVLHYSERPEHEARLSWFLAFGPHKALNVLTAVFWVVALTHVSKERIVSIIRVTILYLLLAQAIWIGFLHFLANLFFVIKPVDICQFRGLILGVDVPTSVRHKVTVSWEGSATADAKVTAHVGGKWSLRYFRSESFAILLWIQRVPNSNYARRPTVPNKAFCGFPHFLQTNAGIVP
jgi:hypothetical protein